MTALHKFEIVDDYLTKYFPWSYKKLFLLVMYNFAILHELYFLKVE